MEIIHWRGIIESLLFAAGDEGLTMKQICEVLEIEGNGRTSDSRARKGVQ